TNSKSGSPSSNRPKRVCALSTKRSSGKSRQSTRSLSSPSWCRSQRTPEGADLASGGRGVRPHHAFVFSTSVGLRLDLLGLDRDTVDRTDLHALRRVEVPDALGALPRVDDVDLHALRNRVIGTLRLADVAIDALVGDHQRHGGGSTFPGLAPRQRWTT